MNIKNLLFLFVLVSVCKLWAAPAERAVVVREANLYIAPDKGAQKLRTVGRGREVAIIEKSRDFLHVFANVEGGPNTSEERERQDISGWILDKGVIRTSTPNGDKILFGEAADSEVEASKRGGRRGAAQDAMRLYARLAEYFPNSPLAGEALWRSADIQWQMEKQEASLRPSAKERDPIMRLLINEEYMKDVEKKFPHTKWADLAAYERLDNKLCGDWQASPRCPEKESEIYEKYAGDRPQSPRAAEALYEAAWRQAVLVDMYKSRDQGSKAEAARKRANQIAQHIISQYSQSDFATRATRLIYMLENNIPVYGNAID